MTTFVENRVCTYLSIKDLLAPKRNANKIGRPQNEFILYRKEILAELKNNNEKHTLREVSQIASLRWKSESTERRNFFIILSKVGFLVYRDLYEHYCKNDNANANANNSTDNENQTITYDSVNDINCINYNCDGESDSSTEQPKYSVFTPNFEVLVERETSLLGSNTSSPPWSGSASMPQMLLVPSYPEMVESPSKRLLSLRTPPKLATILHQLRVDNATATNDSNVLDQPSIDNFVTSNPISIASTIMDTTTTDNYHYLNPQHPYYPYYPQHDQFSANSTALNIENVNFDFDEMPKFDEEKGYCYHDDYFVDKNRHE
ncbi:16665_t:CDS:2 [Entrophospora sp. SA101]|nr:6585_t:CDS:2 [Entrophospora sp. SA101]CAJ0646283.1 8696_t:CDS:2 [Entrophospora sp. SA101]CAJ0751916.1 20331_t:CDS:2 [Entrophospora sp. SA101]CAJ0768455.1 16665_t:CDS:2 [Entrophospora sp. SA101]CAJ0836113.1 8722_t:CDS:2 [Entrophospora sp. SA101]